ncbi:hypothetical protein GC207_14735 [bacterium]|nr:hypothetical protein [bacterium]
MTATIVYPWMAASDLAEHVADCSMEELHVLRIKGVMPRDLWRRRAGGVMFHRDTIAWLQQRRADPALWLSADALADLVFRGSADLVHGLRQQGKLPGHLWRGAGDQFEYHHDLVAWPVMNTVH